jgi:hypothetical protein
MPLSEEERQEIWYDPPPGTADRPDSYLIRRWLRQITLVYSEYPTVTIPSDIIGKPIAEATAELEKLGIVVRTSNRDTTKMPQSEIDALKGKFGQVIESVRLLAHRIHKKKTTTLRCISIDW